MWTFCIVLLVFSHLHEFGVDAIIDDNAIYNQQIKTVTIPDTPQNCLFVSSETGYFTYKSTSNRTTTCGIYFVTSSRNLIEIAFTQFDVPCNKNRGVGGLVQYRDGWELKREVFPSEEGLSKYSTEETEFCSDNKPLHKTFVSSQNGAQISYRIPHIGKGFTIFVDHKKHPSPCNIIHFDEPYYLLQNHGQKRNCSIWASYPTAVQFNSFNIGNRNSRTSNILQCAHAADHIEIGGGHLDPNRIEILNFICSKAEANVFHEDLINCPSSTIKLVSSGNHDNRVNISMRPVDASVDKITNAKYSCISSTK
ncbi:corticotropin-releasing factor-binding protein [Phymastichus coffea]|uniref:corticotropin-releasing factor-binding protein n=1 Tax=Phymastichus coffea TaxID=108790 RepID=UPI00273C2030|nr:corticotropin-releasing factor-binding protein [Phymastichus coffea]XP_058797344.1 corticotropin-releasing factor-binding protein [Phymastichus coffea]XP_058797345.1 corticotropin-releasing factor-binding protein [Phymastichus coffea]XP_058797346.1 corticotropin-releasing factor-binding protein [Phymastichus coffea]XP_058797347.1 corticotropin-releasing factor-binding protein [Phymastichus coffea]XP_058797348.1 corticotropin-releasing factor-binding protein [Phymastichus coffea]XP_05879734